LAIRRPLLGFGKVSHSVGNSGLAVNQSQRQLLVGVRWNSDVIDCCHRL